MLPIEIEVSGQSYRINKLDAMKQFHVSRKIAPLIPALVPIFLTVAKMEGGLRDNMGAIAQILQPFADGIAGLPDAAAEFVMGTCLSVVQRRHGDSWAPVWSSGSNVCMFDDMDMMTLITLTVRVIKENLGNFTLGLLTSQQETSDVSTPA